MEHISWRTPERLDEHLEQHPQLVERAAEELTYVMHGSGSQQDSAQIWADGLRCTEGRATLTANLSHAVGWAEDHDRRQDYSHSQTEVETGETGKVFVLAAGSSLRVGLGTLTDMSIHPGSHSVVGSPLKWAAGLKQLGVYDQHGHLAERRAELEAEKLHLGEMRKDFASYTSGLGEIDTTDRAALASLPNDHAEEAVRRFDALVQQEHLANPPLHVGPEQIALALSFLPEAKERIAYLGKVAVHLEAVDFEGEMARIAAGTAAEGRDDVSVEEVLPHLLRSTVDAAFVTRSRVLFLSLFEAHGYHVLNQNMPVQVNQFASVERLQEAVHNFVEAVRGGQMPITSPRVGEYVRENAEVLAAMLEG